MYIQLIGRMEALPNGAAETAPCWVVTPSICTTLWPGTNGAVRFHADRAHARAAAAVRDAEGFMQVEVRNVRADVTGVVMPTGVHVGAVQIHLTAELMHDLAHFANGFFIHAVGRRVGHHDAREFFARLLCLDAQIVQIDVAVLVAGDHHHAHARHLGGGRVGAMRGARDQADVAARFVTAFVVATDRQQAGVFALRAGVRLHAHRVITGQLYQPLRQLADHLLVAGSLLRRAERMQLGEFRR